MEFKVIYHCLENEIKVGDYYLRLLLEEDERVMILVREKENRLSSEHIAAVENGLRPVSRTSVTEPNGDNNNGTESDTKSEHSHNSKLSTVESEVGAVGGVIKIRQRYFISPSITDVFDMPQLILAIEIFLFAVILIHLL